jgi:hypothetical protein
MPGCSPENFISNVPRLLEDLELKISAFDTIAGHVPAMSKEGVAGNAGVASDEFAVDRFWNSGRRASFDPSHQHRVSSSLTTSSQSSHLELVEW